MLVQLRMADEHITTKTHICACMDGFEKYYMHCWIIYGLWKPGPSSGRKKPSMYIKELELVVNFRRHSSINEHVIWKLDKWNQVVRELCSNPD